MLIRVTEEVRKKQQEIDDLRSTRLMSSERKHKVITHLSIRHTIIDNNWREIYLLSSCRMKRSRGRISPLKKGPSKSTSAKSLAERIRKKLEGEVVDLQVTSVHTIFFLLFPLLYVNLIVYM